MKLVLALLACLLAAPAPAKEPIFVSSEQSRMAEFLPSPPADGSADQKAELNELHAVEAQRTEADVKQAQFDAENENIFAFANVLGDKFNATALPLTAAFGKRVANDESVNVNPVKAYFHRIHPYTYDATLKPVCKAKGLPDAYPSGHATVGYLLGLTLAEMAPEKRDDILDRADAFARSRLICGVHYPSDIRASKSLAYAVHALMTANPQYRVELAAAKEELRKALGLP